MLKVISKKVILIGHIGVGKSALVKRFVHDIFSDEILSTIGVRIDNKVLEVENNELNMVIWNVAGQESQSKIPLSYLLGAHGCFYVFDASRPSTFKNLLGELDYIKEVLPKIPIYVIGNKADLIQPDELENLNQELTPESFHLVSAKTGESVNEVFNQLAERMVR